MRRRRGRRTRPCGRRVTRAPVDVGVASRARRGTRAASSRSRASRWRRPLRRSRRGSRRPRRRRPSRHRVHVVEDRRRTAASTVQTRVVTRTAAASAPSPRASRRSSARAWSKSMRPASGSSSIASTTGVAIARERRLDRGLLRRTRSAAAIRRAPDGAAPSSRPCTPSPSAVHMPRRRRRPARSGHWPVFGMFSGRCAALPREERVDHRRDHLARRHRRHLVDARILANSAL